MPMRMLQYDKKYAIELMTLNVLKEANIFSVIIF